MRTAPPWPKLPDGLWSGRKRRNGRGGRRGVCSLCYSAHYVPVAAIVGSNVGYGLISRLGNSRKRTTVGSAIGLEVVGVSETAGVPESPPPTIRTAQSDRSSEWTFPPEPGSVRAARALVRSTLNEWNLNTVSDLAVLLVSELVTNALRHASGSVGVRVERIRNDALLVEVSDARPDVPLERDATPDDEGGRGLRLVARMSQRWGARTGPEGKTVWFELGLSG